MTDGNKNNKVDDFIGTTFPTPNGGVLTVVGWDGERSGRTKKYTIECSICSKDTELFLDDFKSTKGHLVNGYVPCGCAKSPRWSEYQYKVRVQRECRVRGYIFHGWVEKFKGCKTKLDLENLKTGNRWGSTNIDRLMRGKGDPEEGKLKRKESKTLDDNVHSKAFHKAGFAEDYVFTRSTERVGSRGWDVYWDYTCPTCSTDEYVKAGVCSGVFTSFISSLKKGIKSCRCGKSYRWTQKQREYQINKVCHEEGLTFISWCDEKVGYKSNKSKFNWKCSQGHDCKTSVVNFLSHSARCMTCRKDKQKEQGVGYGYYPHRTQEEDSLYILNFDNQYIKIGRSFQVDTRIKQLKKESGITNINILRCIKGTHQEIYDLEQFLHMELRDRGFEYQTDWGSVECFDLDSLKLTYKLIEEELRGSNNTLEGNLL